MARLSQIVTAILEISPKDLLLLLFPTYHPGDTRCLLPGGRAQRHIGARTGWFWIAEEEQGSKTWELPGKVERTHLAFRTVLTIVQLWNAGKWKTGEHPKECFDPHLVVCTVLKPYRSQPKSFSLLFPVILTFPSSMPPFSERPSCSLFLKYLPGSIKGTSCSSFFL